MPTNVSAQPDQLPSPTNRLAASVFAGYLAFGATLQLLPPWIAQRFHGGPPAVGVAIGIAFGAAAVCRPLAGRAGDAGHARIVVMSAGVLITVGALEQWLAPALSVVMVARLIMGIGEAALFNGALPWVLAEVPAERRGRTAGWFGLSMWSGLALGPVVTVMTTHVAGLAASWVAVAALGVSSVLFASATPRQRRGDVAPAPRITSWRDVLPRGAGLPGLIFGAAAYAHTLTAAMIGTALTGAGVGLMFPAVVALTLNRVKGERAGAAVGAASSLWDIGIMIAGLLGGALTGLGYPAAFAAAAVIVCAAAILAGTLSDPATPRAPRRESLS